MTPNVKWVHHINFDNLESSLHCSEVQHPTQFCTYISPIPQAICPIAPVVTFERFHGTRNEKLPRVLHGIAEEDKGPKLIFGSFKSPPPIDIKDVEVNPLHVIFYCHCWEGLFQK